MNSFAYGIGDLVFLRDANETDTSQILSWLTMVFGAVIEVRETVPVIVETSMRFRRCNRA